VLYCYLIDTTHLSRRELDDWDIPFLKAWYKHSKGFPPLREIVAKAVGYQPVEPEKPAMSYEDHTKALMAKLTGM